MIGAIVNVIAKVRRAVARNGSWKPPTVKRIPPIPGPKAKATPIVVSYIASTNGRRFSEKEEAEIAAQLALQDQQQQTNICMSSRHIRS